MSAGTPRSTAPPQAHPARSSGRRFPTKKAANDWLTDTRKEIADGTYLSPQERRAQQEQAKALAAQQEQQKASAWTVETWCRHVLSTDTRRRVSTREQYLRALERHIFPELGSTPLPDLKAADLERHYTAITTRQTPAPPGSSPCTARTPRCPPA